MLYMGIDQHRKQLTICVREQNGEIVLCRQVSTKWDAVITFFENFAAEAVSKGGYAACVEVCGFN